MEGFESSLPLFEDSTSPVLAVKGMLCRFAPWLAPGQNKLQLIRGDGAVPIPRSIPSGGLSGFPIRISTHNQPLLLVSM